MTRKVEAHQLLGKLHLDPALQTQFDIGLVQDDLDPWPKDPGLFELGYREQDGTLRFLARINPFGAPILQTGTTGEVVLTPLSPVPWGHLRPGSTLQWFLFRTLVDIQIIEGLDLEYLQKQEAALTPQQQEIWARMKKLLHP